MLHVYSKNSFDCRETFQKKSKHKVSFLNEVFEPQYCWAVVLLFYVNLSKPFVVENYGS